VILEGFRCKWGGDIRNITLSAGVISVSRTSDTIVGLHHQLGRNVTLQWISANEKACGNEAAGVAAREANRWRENQRSWTGSAQPPDLQTLTSTAESRVRAWTIARWLADLDKARYGRVTHKTAPGPSQKNPIKYRGLERPRAFMLAQASADKIGLESYPSPRRRCRQFLYMWRRRAYAECAAADGLGFV